MPLDSEQRRQAAEAKRLLRQSRRNQQSDDDALDGFEDSIGLFGDSKVAHGEAGKLIEYDGIKLHLANVDGGAVGLMAHFVWNAAFVLAEYIKHDQGALVKGKRVLEFGAAAGLDGLLAVKQGAAFVTLSDYPDPKVISNLEHNWRENILIPHLQHTPALEQGNLAEVDSETRKEWEQECRSAIRGHAWGESVAPLLDCITTGQRDNDESDNRYDLVMMADTLWVADGHRRLLESCKACLAPKPESKIIVCCGLHTGFRVVRQFLDMAQSSPFDYKVRLKEIRQQPRWGETRTIEEQRADAAKLGEEDLLGFDVEERNRTVLVYELSLLPSLYLTKGVMSLGPGPLHSMAYTSVPPSMGRKPGMISLDKITHQSPSMIPYNHIAFLSIAKMIHAGCAHYLREWIRPGQHYLQHHPLSVSLFWLLAMGALISLSIERPWSRKGRTPSSWNWNKIMVYGASLAGQMYLFLWGLWALPTFRSNTLSL
ncbi:hypothetical protein BGW42_003857 [Actinomortierella wolfii]|nr:hypothetical protein BGW42_003857 [Actinomortierella wolfii]